MPGAVNGSNARLLGLGYLGFVLGWTHPEGSQRKAAQSRAAFLWGKENMKTCQECGREFKYRHLQELHNEKYYHFLCQKSGKIFPSQLQEGPDRCPCCYLYTWNNPEGATTGSILDGINNAHGCEPFGCVQVKSKSKYPRPSKRAFEPFTAPGIRHGRLRHEV